MAAPLRVATRGSALARWQARRVTDLLGTDSELVVVQTTGDRRADVPIHAIGGTGVFVKEVQAAVLEGRADLAVHAAKDLPSADTPGLTLAAVPERGDPRDALVGSSLEALPLAARIGTGSVRRRAQLAALRPDLTFGSLRGNIGTRLERARDFDAVVVAAAALDRLELADRAAERLDPAIVLPQVGQGALAVECRTGDEATRERLALLDRPELRLTLTAERAFLAELGGGCDLPCGALATVVRDEASSAFGRVSVDGLLASLDGHVVLRTTVRDDDSAVAGRRAARAVLDEQGGRQLLEHVAPVVGG